jgi:2-polyprenyl-3-methyl-5-hydroxy-6-metoxy-1,4-benzoquinol methylase
MKSRPTMAQPSPGSWNSYWSSSGEGFQKESFSKKRIIAVLDKYVFTGAQVLDAGCGSGFFSSYFLSRGCVVDALDYSDQALEMARKNTEGKCRQYYRTDLTGPGAAFLGGAYDLIFSDGLLEHFSLSDQSKIIALLASKKKSGGCLVTVVPNMLSPWQLIRPFFMPGIREKPFTRRALVRLHDTMKIIEQGGVNVLPCSWSPERSTGAIFGMLLYCVCR